MQLTAGVLSALLLASSAIPSVVAQRWDRERERERGRGWERTTTIFRTRIFWETTTEKTTYLSTTTITSIRPTVIEENRRTTITSTTTRKRIAKADAAETVTVTTTVSSCAATTATLETKEPSPTSEQKEDPYSTCPPVATVTAERKCDSSKPECPRERRCVAGQPRIIYGCNCSTAPPRTTTISTRCPEECCGGYGYPRYDKLEICTGTMTAPPKSEETSLDRPPKLPPITVSDDEQEPEEPQEPEKPETEKAED
ncbi:hypothetical protein TWF730_009713 [Orbilia blumenaviensis]|uniref:Uncharacterized protein n=1 Tax=Orbilia blumenaviensis TaxID=1796055 RepID=A0AAV9UWR1_9PEZI